MAGSHLVTTQKQWLQGSLPATGKDLTSVQAPLPLTCRSQVIEPTLRPTARNLTGAQALLTACSGSPSTRLNAKWPAWLEGPPRSALLALPLQEREYAPATPGLDSPWTPAVLPLECTRLSCPRPMTLPGTPFAHLIAWLTPTQLQDSIQEKPTPQGTAPPQTR